MGALGDSFYEYLLKAYIQGGGVDIEARQMYDDAMDAFEKNGLIRYSKSGLMYFAEMKYDRIESKMDHLACFAGKFRVFIRISLRGLFTDRWNV